jgi:hypothetical protein
MMNSCGGKVDQCFGGLGRNTGAHDQERYGSGVCDSEQDEQSTATTRDGEG